MSSLKKYKMHIAGKWGKASLNNFSESENPYTGKPWALIPNGWTGLRRMDKKHEQSTSGFF